MSDKQILTVALRDARGKKNKAIRAEGGMPAVVYGHGVEAQAITVNQRDFQKAFKIAGGNQIVGLKIGDARQKNVIVQDAQFDARTGDVTHADLYVVKMNETLKTDVPLRYVGETEAVTREQGSLIESLQTVEVEALPGDLPEAIEVDVTKLVDFDATIHVADLVAPAGVTILTDGEELVAKVEAPRSEEELAELDEPVEGEVATEDEEAAEGEESAEGDSAPAKGDEKSDKE